MVVHSGGSSFTANRKPAMVYKASFKLDRTSSGGPVSKKAQKNVLGKIKRECGASG